MGAYEPFAAALLPSWPLLGHPTTVLPLANGLKPLAQGAATGIERERERERERNRQKNRQEKYRQSERSERTGRQTRRGWEEWGPEKQTRER